MRVGDLASLPVVLNSPHLYRQGSPVPESSVNEKHARMDFSDWPVRLLATWLIWTTTFYYGHADTHPRHQIRTWAVRFPSVGFPEITLTDQDRLLRLGVCDVGYNDISSGAHLAWIGEDGPYVNHFHNQAGEDIILVLWGPAASWVNVHRPLVTLSLPPNKTITISFATGAVGAWSAVYLDTPSVDLHNGQIFNTWGEFTFSSNGVVDVSREVNMNGHALTIVGPQCTSDMNRCVFVCPDSATCMEGYELRNCEPGSQPGAQYGLDAGAASGGCGGLGSSVELDTYFE